MAKKDRVKGAVGLEITTETVEPCQARLTVVVTPERVEAEMGLVAQAYARQLRVPGYRPGKVPMRVVAAQVGEDELREAAQEQLVEKVAREVVRAEGLDPSGPILLEDQQADPLTFIFLLPLVPEVDLGDYRALRVPEPETEPVTDEDVAEVVERLRQDVAHLETVDRPAEAGDLMIVSLVGRLEDKIVVEAESVGLTLSPAGASEHQLPPTVVDHLVGLSAGDEHAFSATYSEFWPQPELQAQEVAFQATVESVSGPVIPELDDAFAQEVSDFQTVAELEEGVRESLASRRRRSARSDWLDAAVAALADQADVRYPPQLLDGETEQALDSLRERVERQGFTWERWLELQEKDEDGVRAELEDEAAVRLRSSLVLSEFARAEGIETSRADVEAALRRQQEALAGSGLRLPRTDSVRRRMGNELLTRRALDRLLEIVGGEGAVADGSPVPAAEVDDDPSADVDVAPSA